MKFSEFASLLFPFIGTGSSTHAFTKTVFDAIVTEAGQDALAGYSPNTYKAYFNGQTEITKLAQKISAYIEPAEFIDYIERFPDATVQSLCDRFQPYLLEISPFNAGEKLADLFASIIIEAASTKKKGTPRGAKKEKPPTSSRLEKAILESGAVLAEKWNSAVEQLLDVQDDTVHTEDSADTSDKKNARMNIGTLTQGDKTLLKGFRDDSKRILLYIINHDPASGETEITLADEINCLTQKWQFDLREIEDGSFRNLVIQILKTLGEYIYYISNVFLRSIPERGVLWFRNESWEEGERLRNILQPKSLELRSTIGRLYIELYPIPEDNNFEEETIEPEVVDDREPSGAAEEDTEGKKITVIQHQTNIVQNGENNFNLTNNGTMNFKF